MREFDYWKLELSTAIRDSYINQCLFSLSIHSICIIQWLLVIEVGGMEGILGIKGFGWATWGTVETVGMLRRGGKGGRGRLGRGANGGNGRFGRGGSFGSGRLRRGPNGGISGKFTGGKVNSEGGFVVCRRCLPATPLMSMTMLEKHRAMNKAKIMELLEKEGKEEPMADSLLWVLTCRASSSLVFSELVWCNIQRLALVLYREN